MSVSKESLSLKNRKKPRKSGSCWRKVKKATIRGWARLCRRIEMPPGWGALVILIVAYVLLEVLR